MPELITHLRAMRADLAGTMADELAVEGDWYVWLPLLAQIEMVIQAVEGVMEERAGPARTQENDTYPAAGQRKAGSR